METKGGLFDSLGQVSNGRHMMLLLLGLSCLSFLLYPLFEPDGSWRQRIREYRYYSLHPVPLYLSDFGSSP